jgi:type IV secretory pathway TrbD component
MLGQPSSVPGFEVVLHRSLTEPILLADPEFAKRVTATGQVVRPGNAAGFAAEIDEQRGRIAEAAKAAGLAK